MTYRTGREATALSRILFALRHNWGLPSDDLRTYLGGLGVPPELVDRLVEGKPSGRPKDNLLHRYWDHLTIREEVEDLAAEVGSREAAKGRIAQKYGCSKSTIEKMLKPPDP